MYSVFETVDEDGEVFAVELSVLQPVTVTTNITEHRNRLSIFLIISYPPYLILIEDKLTLPSVL